MTTTATVQTLRPVINVNPALSRQDGDMMMVNKQWSKRPADQRFTSLLDLQAYKRAIRENSRAKVVSSRVFTLEPDPADQMKGLQVVGQNGTPAFLTHHSFGQLAGLAKAPAGYLRTLPAPMAADCLNFGLKHARSAEDVGILLTNLAAQNSDPLVQLRAANGPNYGRIWDVEVTDALVNHPDIGDGLTGRFKVPGEFGKAVQITKENTTLYASDRDMFVFLADESRDLVVTHRRDGKDGHLSRGFIVWNSEVGDCVLGVAFFLFDYVCCNRIIWGMQDYQEVRIRHTASAPDKWLEEVSPTLIAYANASAEPIEAAIRAAQQKKLDDVDQFLKGRFGASMVDKLKLRHTAEEGRPIETLWDVTTAATALAKDIPNNSDRIALERDAGKVLQLAA